MESVHDDSEIKDSEIDESEIDVHEEDNEWSLSKIHLVIYTVLPLVMKC